jgi:hypothetical protein
MNSRRCMSASRGQAWKPAQTSTRDETTHMTSCSRQVRDGSCVDGAHGSRDSFGFLLAVGCKSCVRPVCAALIAAGPDVIRRSSPYHSLALKSA